MKKLLFALLFSFVSYGAMAQSAGSVTVRNYTGCWVYYSIMGGPGCSVNIVSNVIALAPGGSINYPSAASIPGFPPGGNNINAGNFYYKPPSCTNIQVWGVGIACTGMLASWTYLLYGANCAACANVTASWTPPATTGGTALYAFN